MNFATDLPRRLKNTLNLRKDEESIVILLLAFSFFQYFSLAILFVTASAIFLTDHSISELPYVFIGTSLMLLFLMLVYNQLEKIMSPKNIILSEAIMLLLVIVIFRFGFNYDLIWIGYGLIIWHRVMADYIDDGFNRLVLLLLDVRQSKRLYGLVSSSEIPANILGYLAATIFIPFIGTVNLLWISAAGLLISLIFLFRIVSGTHKDLITDVDNSESEKTDEEEPENLFKKIFKTQFIFILSLTISFSVITFIFIEFAFLHKVELETENQQDIVMLMAIVFGLGQVAAFFLKTFFYAFIHRKYGIKFTLFALPVTLAVISVAVIIESFLPNSTTLLIYSWIFIMFISDTLNTSLYKTSFISLLQPLARKMKMQGYKIMNNIEVLAIGIGGIILVLTFSESNDGLLHYSYLLLGGVVGWIACIPVLNKYYLKTLEEGLKKRIIETSALEINTPQTLEIIHDKLKSKYPGEVIYALDVLCKDKTVRNSDLMGELLSHPLPEVRKEVYSRIKSLKIKDLQQNIKSKIQQEASPAVKKAAVETYCALGEADVVDEISNFLDSENPDLRAGALVGLVSYGGINGIIIAGQRLMEHINSPDPTERAFGAYVIGEVGIHNFYHPLLMLLKDKKVEVRREALIAAGKIKHPNLYEPLVHSIFMPNLFEVAINALIKCDAGVIDVIEQQIESLKDKPKHLRRLIRVCGRIESEKSILILKDKFHFPNIEVRDQVLHSCSLLGYKPAKGEKSDILNAIHAELADATWFLNCIKVLMHTNKWLEKANFDLLIRALNIELKQLKKRILYLMSFLYESKEIVQVWSSLQMKDRTKIANALEILDVLASKDLTVVVLPLLENFPLSHQLKIFNSRYKVPEYSLDKYLSQLITGEGCPAVIPWTRAVAIYNVHQMPVPALVELLEVTQGHKEELYSETAGFTLEKIQLETQENLITPAVTLVEEHKKQVHMSTKLLTIEKVMALKTTEIFRETTEDLLVDIASILKEISYKKDDLIVQKNEIGTCMYIIYSGSVLIHDGDFKLAELKEGNFFGELSLLDTEPRSASVTALEDSLLLRIDQQAFYEIMADRMEVIREMMKILCQRLRKQNVEVATLREKLKS
ncbi:MAG: MFS transporter [Candidatus Cyclobacteriaceae bacterium M2_1C_046]